MFYSTSLSTAWAQGPADVIAIDGATLQAVAIDEIVTASGRWQFASLGNIGDIAAYRWRREGADGTRVMLCRDPVVARTPAAVPLALTILNVQIGAMQAKAAVAPGSCRIVENRPLVEPRVDWIVAAVRSGRVPAYRRDRSWRPVAPKPIAAAAAYDPGEIGRHPSGRIAAASANFVGVTSPQGGEYTASRGFLHDIDARAIELALANQAIGDWPTLVRYSWESLGQPHGAVWSARNHVTMDPQVPLVGDRQWDLFPALPEKTGAVDALANIEGWSRDPAHLENTCYVHWLATEDPVAGLCVQRQLAYALAHYLRGHRALSPGRYVASKGQTRAIFNTMSALWKARDVALRARTTRGVALWDTGRVGKMTDDVFAYYDNTMVPDPASLDPQDQAIRAASLLAPTLANEQLVDPQDGTRRWIKVTSDFMLPQYGKEPLYLWSLAGNPLATKWMNLAGRHLAARVELIGGARGVDQCSGHKGSSLPIAETTPNARNPNYRDTRQPTWSDLAGWSRWVNSLCPQQPNDRYDGAAIHTATQIEGALLLFRAAGMTGLDPAIQRMTSDRGRTTKLRYPNLNMAKHWASP